MVLKQGTIKKRTNCDSPCVFLNYKKHHNLTKEHGIETNLNVINYCEKCEKTKKHIGTNGEPFSQSPGNLIRSD